MIRYVGHPFLRSLRLLPAACFVCASALADGVSYSMEFVEHCRAEQSHASLVACVQEYADAGNVRAQEELGLWYVVGRHVKHDPQAGAAWLFKAAVHESPTAMRRLGMLYMGNKVLVPGYAWLLVAVRYGDNQSLELLKRFDPVVDAATKQKALAFASALETTIH